MPPMATVVAPVKPEPRMTTVYVPKIEPEDGPSPVTVGSGGATNVNWSAPEMADLPKRVVTVTSTTPAGWAGMVAVITPSELVWKDAAVPPKETAVAPVKLLPTSVTSVPPRVDPEAGPSPVTAGELGGGVEVW